jgi:hypothetical protein
MSEIMAELKGYVGDKPLLKTNLLNMVGGNKKFRETAFQRLKTEKTIILVPGP